MRIDSFELLAHPSLGIIAQVKIVWEDDRPRAEHCEVGCDYSDKGVMNYLLALCGKLTNSPVVADIHDKLIEKNVSRQCDWSKIFHIGATRSDVMLRFNFVTRTRPKAHAGGMANGVLILVVLLDCLDLSCFGAAPLIAFTSPKETDYGTETGGQIPPRCGEFRINQWAEA